MTDENKMTSSESTNDVQEIKDMIIQLRKDVGYLYGLIETVVENINLSHKSRSGADDIIKLNTQLVSSILQGKSFEGKDQLLNIIDKLQNIGVKQ